MNKYEIVFVDIDDTLNKSNETVSNYTKNIMQKLKEKGIKVVVNTGRSAHYAIEKSKEAHLSDYIISSNGAEVYNYKQKKIIYSKPIKIKDIKGIYKYCSDIDEVLKNNKINQMVILSSNYDRMLVLPSLFKEKFPSLKVIHSSIGLIEEKREKNKEYYHDFVIENTAKSTGIVELLDYLNIDSQNAIAIGNGYDDLCMTDVVGTSIAVANANNLLKESSTYLTDSAENDGVAKILEKLCLNK